MVRYKVSKWLMSSGYCNNYTESVDDKLSWMEVLNAATESQSEPQDKFDKGRKSVRQRLNRRVSLFGAK